MIIIVINPRTTEAIAARVMVQFVINIMMREPVSMVMDVTRVVKLLFKFCPSESTSFVMRERMSPVVFL